MRRRIIMQIIVVTLLMPLGIYAATDGQLNELLKKLENLELRLIEHQNIGVATNQLAFAETGYQVATNDSSMSDFDSRADRIYQEIDRINASSSRNTGTDDVETLAFDLRNLVNELRGTIGQKPQQEPGVSLDLQPESKLSPISISGFGDFSYAATKESGESDNLALGQAEIDLETAYDDKIVMTAAIAYDPGLETFGLGQFTIDFQLFGSREDHFFTAAGIDHAGIVVGQFDVPFGLDWKVYPSIDRKMISGPLAVENTHDFWNDYGVQAYVENRWFNAVAYGTNGFGYDEVEMNHSVGGRLGVKPFGLLELGSSYAGFFSGSRDLDMYLLGFDLQFNYRSLALKGEYISRKIGLANSETGTSDGFYGQALYDLGRFFVTGRYDVFSPMEATEKNNTRYSGGGGMVVMDGVEIRLEHQLNSTLDDATFLQVVVGF